MSTDDETLAERIAQAIEADRMRLTASSGSPERAWQAGHNKGLSDAAYIARSFATPAQPAVSQEAVAVTDEMVERAARRWYRDENGPINHHDSERTSETDEADRDLAFGWWDRGSVAEPVKNGYRSRARAALEAADLTRPAQSEAAIRADERERLACDAEERGDIGKEGQISVWRWLRSESAATSMPRKWRSARPAQAAPVDRAVGS